MASTSIQLKQPGEGASCVSDDDELLLLDEDELIVDDNKAALKNTLQIKRVSTGDTVFLNNSNNATSTNIISGRRRFRADPNCAARSHRRQPQISITEQYYGRSTDYTENTQYTSTNVDIDLERGGFTNSKPQSSTQQSRRLPPWLWQTICHLLGVPVQTMPVGNTPQSRLQSCATRPWLGLFIQIVTVIVALIYATTYTCYTAYDIKNIYTKQTLLMGLVHIVIALYWCAMGLYSRSRAASLFQCKRFAASVRVHSKTVFRISSAGILVLLSTTLVVLNDVSSAHTFEAKTCHKLGLPGPLCQVMYISRVLFSIFALLWNLLVAILLLSVCRTHTIGIRRFIRELESDGFTYELLQRHAMLSNENMTEVCSVNDGEDDYVWDDDIPQSLSHDIAPTKQQQQQQQQHLKTLASLSRRRRSTLSLPASGSGCGSIIPDGRSSAFLSVENVSQHNAGNLGNHAQNPGSQSNTTLPSIVIGDNVMVDYCNLENETSEGQRGARSKRSPVHSVPDDESSDQPAPGPVPGVSAGVSNFGMTLDCDESTAEVSSSVMAHASPPGEELPQWRKYTATRTRPVCSDYGGLEDGSLEDVSLSDIQILSNNSILLSYWKISCRLRTTSIVLQRWLMAVIMFIMLWNVTYIIHWVSHQTTVLGIAQFVIPLLLLPIICSAYAEVNMEGRRMLKSICPTPGRMDMLFYLAQQPLEVTAFGFPINYSTIVKAMGAMVLAFCTRLILDEINM